MHEPNEFEALRRETTSWWWVSRRKLLREAVWPAVGGKREARVLDLGCTADTGRRRPIGAAGSQRSFGVAGAGVSPDARTAARSSARILKSSALAPIPSTPSSPATYLQSVGDDVAVLREMRRVLKDGASLCLTVPAYPSLWGERDEAAGHQRRYTANELRRKLNNSGFEVTRVSYLVASGFVPSFIERIGKNIFTKSIDRYAPCRRGAHRR